MGIMTKVVLCIAVVFALTIGVIGCAELKSAGRGAVAGITQSGKEAAVERVDQEDRIPSDLKPLVKDVVRSIPDAPLPEPKDSLPEQTVWYGIAFLVAKLLGDVAKGLVRSKIEKDKAP